MLVKHFNLVQVILPFLLGILDLLKLVRVYGLLVHVQEPFSVVELHVQLRDRQESVVFSLVKSLNLYLHVRDRFLAFSQLLGEGLILLLNFFNLA